MYNDFDNVEMFNKAKDIDPTQASLEVLNVLLESNIEQTLRHFADEPSKHEHISKPQLSKDQKIEIFAQRIGERLEADDLHPIYAACYAGITFEKLESIATHACLVGRVPIKLFMHLVKKEPEWLAWQLRRK